MNVIRLRSERNIHPRTRRRAPSWSIPRTSYASAFGNAFENFVRAADGVRVLCADDDETAALAERLRADGVDLITYGTAADASHRMIDVVPGRDGVSFSLLSEGHRVDDLNVVQC